MYMQISGLLSKRLIKSARKNVNAACCTKAYNSPGLIPPNSSSSTTTVSWVRTTDGT